MTITTDTYGRYIIGDESGTVIATRVEWSDVLAFLAGLTGGVQ